MVILRSTALAGLPPDLGVEVKKVLLVYFERHARRVALAFPRTPTNPLLSTNDFLSSSGQAAVVGPNRLKPTKSN